MTVNMKGTIIIILIFAFISNVYGQPSYSKYIRFRLFDKEGNMVNRKTFVKDYKIADVFGRFMKMCDSCTEINNSIKIDTSTNYIYIKLHTIGPRFSFAIYRLADTMTIFLPFRQQHYLSADSLTMHNGDYLFDFPCNNKMDRVQPDFYKHPKELAYCTITKIDFEKQSSLFKESGYYGQEYIYRKMNKYFNKE